MDKISVIVPVYNAANNLSRCIESILKQTYRNLEIILVNDGSTDESLEICKRYSDIDFRISVVNKNNGGVSSARNVGLKVASGDYIGFVDADDWIEPEMYNDMITMIKKYKTDICMCNYYDGSDLISMDIEGNQLSQSEIFEQVIRRMISPLPHTGSQPIMASVWRFLIKKEIIVDNNIDFNENIPYMEDTIFMITTLLSSNKLCLNKKYLYHYENNSDSAMRNYKSNYFNIGKQVFEKISDTMREFKKDELAKDNMRLRYLNMCIAAIINETHENNPKNLQDILESVKYICNDKILRKILENLDIGNIEFPKKINLYFLKNNNYKTIYIYYKLGLYLKNLRS